MTLNSDGEGHEQVEQKSSTCTSTSKNGYVFGSENYVQGSLPPTLVSDLASRKLVSDSFIEENEIAHLQLLRPMSISEEMMPTGSDSFGPEMMHTGSDPRLVGANGTASSSAPWRLSCFLCDCASTTGTDEKASATELGILSVGSTGEAAASG